MQPGEGAIKTHCLHRGGVPAGGGAQRDAVHAVAKRVDVATITPVGIEQAGCAIAPPMARETDDVHGRGIQIVDPAIPSADSRADVVGDAGALEKPCLCVLQAGGVIPVESDGRARQFCNKFGVVADDVALEHGRGTRGSHNVHDLLDESKIKPAAV